MFYLIGFIWFMIGCLWWMIGLVLFFTVVLKASIACFYLIKISLLVAEWLKIIIINNSKLFSSIYTVLNICYSPFYWLTLPSGAFLAQAGFASNPFESSNNSFAPEGWHISEIFPVQFFLDPTCSVSRRAGISTAVEGLQHCFRWNIGKSTRRLPQWWATNILLALLSR